MKAFLIQGKENSGKTTLCGLIDKWLLEQGYNFIFNSKEKDYSHHENDFLAVYEKDGKRIIINTWSDNKSLVEYLCKKYEEYKPFDTIITAIRPYCHNKRLHIWLKRAFIDDVSQEIIIDLDILAEQYTIRETFAKNVFEKEFITKF